MSGAGMGMGQAPMEPPVETGGRAAGRPSALAGADGNGGGAGRVGMNMTGATLAVLRAQACIEPISDLSAEQIALRARCIGAGGMGPRDVRRKVHALRRQGHVIEASRDRQGMAMYRIVMGLAKARQTRMGVG